MLNKNNYIRFTICILLIFTIINIGCTIFAIPSVKLSEDQILYIFSSIGQVVAGLFGLIMTAYVFFESKLKDDVMQDNMYYDQVEILRKNYFKMIILISSFCGITIFLCIVCMTFFEIREISSITSILMNETIICFVVEVISILYFGCKLLDPDTLTKESTLLKKTIESNYIDTPKENKKDLFKSYIKYYNMLEHLIISYASELIKTDDRNYNFRMNQGYKPQVLQALKILNSYEIINASVSSEINEIRQYRNGLVHGTEFSINESVYEILKKIYTLLNAIYEVRDDDNKRNISVQELYNYSREVKGNELEERILDLIDSNGKQSIEQLAIELGASISSISRMLKKLKDEGKMVNDGNRNGYWSLSDK